MKSTILSSSFIACLLLAGVSTQLQGKEAETLDPQRDYQATRSNPVTYDVEFSVVVTPPYKTNVLKVWLPIPPSDAAQEVSKGKLSTFPMHVEPVFGTESLYGNKFACFEFHSPQGAQVVRHEFRIKVYELNWNLDPDRMVPVAEWPESFARYRRNESQAVVVDDRFRSLLDDIVPRRSLASRDFGSVMDWVQANFEYDHHEASLSASSEHGLSRRRGHCSDYHGFCASMGRALGVPTRVTYGIAPFPKNSPSHCKLEAWIAPYGWVSFDVSETQKLIRAIGNSDKISGAKKQQLIKLAHSRMERGFRDNTWFLQTRGTDYELAPKASKRVPVVRTAWIEADGVPLAEPDPADRAQTAFSWMTVHQYQADKDVSYPFSDWTTLETQQDTSP